jgi:hypothetical protein
MTVPSVRAKIQAGDEDYQITGDDVPAFLYEDPESYDPEDVLNGFMRGYFLARVSDQQPPWASLTISQCLRAIFKGPKGSMQRSNMRERPPRGSMAHMCRLEAVTVPMIVYVAIQVSN